MAKNREPQNLREVIQEQLDFGNYEFIAVAPNARGTWRDDGFYSLTRLADGWVLGLRLVRQNSVFEVVEAIFLAVDEDGTGGLTTGVFRDFPLGEIIKNARYQASTAQDVISSEAAAHVAEWLDPWKRGARGAQAKRTDAAYAALAAKYVQLVAGGDRSPAATLAVELGISSVTVSQRIREARERGLLTPTPPGTAGGELTEKALSVLTSPVYDALIDETEA